MKLEICGLYSNVLIDSMEIWDSNESSTNGLRINLSYFLFIGFVYVFICMLLLDLTNPSPTEFGIPYNLSGLPNFSIV